MFQHLPAFVVQGGTITNYTYLSNFSETNSVLFNQKYEYLLTYGDTKQANWFKYQRHHDTLIYIAKMRKEYCPLIGYKEKHHVIPKCMNGTDDINNIVELTANEHYVAHQLLTKLFPDNVYLLFACKAMVRYSKFTSGRITNKEYGWIKNRLSEKRKNSIKITNGKINKYLYNGEIMPVGFREGQYISDEKRQRINNIKRSKHTQETKDKISKIVFGKKFYNNGQLNMHLDPNGIIPVGFKLGFLLSDDELIRRQQCSANKTCYNNGIINKMFSPGDVIPDDFVIGLMKNDKIKDRNRGKTCYNNGIINKMFSPGDVIPDDFVLGKLFSARILARNNSWYNNGKMSKMFDETHDVIPDDFVIGRINRDITFYNNGTITKMFELGVEIPAVFIKGLIMSDNFILSNTNRRNSKCYNDGKINKMVNEGDVIPENFKIGKLKTKFK